MFSLSQFSLEGKVALVTGGSRGIGAATAIGFASAGADVAVSSRKIEDLENVAKEINSLGKKGVPIAAHIGKMDQIQKIVDSVIVEFGRIDILVNNAGGNPALASILDSEERLWDKIMGVNLKGLYFLSQKVARVMKDQGGGSIINVSSLDAYQPENNVGIYSISKAGVVMATKSMALELAPFNIRVNAIAPGCISTKMFNSHWFHLSDQEAQVEKNKIADKIPMKKIGDPDDIVGAMVYLASDASNYTTGETILVDGAASIAPFAD